MLRDPSTEISELLDPGEKLLWSGVPRQGVFLRGSDILLIPFSLLWGGFAIFWEASVLVMVPRASSHGNAPPFFNYIFPLFGLPFVVIGLYLIFGRFFVDSAIRGRTVYAITDRRIIIRSGLFSRSTKSLNLRTLSDVTLSEKDDGRGTITLGPSVGIYSMFQGTSWPGMGRHAVPILDSIADAKAAYEILRRAQHTAG